MRVKDWSKKNVEVGRELHRRSHYKNFPNRCASKIDRRRMWMMVKRSISQPMRAKNWSKKNVEVSEENHRRSLNENFPTDTRHRSIEEECGSWRRSPSKIAPQNFYQQMRLTDRPKKNVEVGEARSLSKIARQNFYQKMHVTDRSKKNVEVGD